MIDNIKLLTKSDDTDLLTLLINQCKEYARSYCNYRQYAEELDCMVELMVVERFNKLSAEGISSRNFSSISEVYTDDYSLDIYRGLNKYRKLKVV